MAVALKAAPRKTWEAQAADDAHDLATFAEALDNVGLTDVARRARIVAQDCLKALEHLADERRLRAAVTEDRDRWRDNRWRETHGQQWPQ